MKPSLLLAAALLWALPCFGAPKKPTPTPAPSIFKPKPTPTPKPDAKPEAKPLSGPAPELKLLKAECSSPLYIRAEAGVNQLANVTLTATATPTRPGTPVEVVFNPSLGDNGTAVLKAVKAILTEIHQRWPAGHRVEILCNPPVAQDDAGAAALATAILLDSLIGGWEADPSCSIVGGLQASGKIQGATAAVMRLTTASRGNSSRIIMPEKNATQASDCLVNVGPANAGRIQMFAVRTFEDIMLMAAAKLEDNMTKSIAFFQEAQKQIEPAGDKADQLLKDDSDLRETLRSALENCPNHMTARLLLGRTTGRYLHFSLHSSLNTIAQVTPTVQQGILSPRPMDVTKLPAAKLKQELEILQGAQSRMDPRASKYLGAVLRYATAASGWYTHPPTTNAEVAKVTAELANAAGDARDQRTDLATVLTTELSTTQ